MVALSACSFHVNSLVPHQCYTDEWVTGFAWWVVKRENLKWIRFKLPAWLRNVAANSFSLLEKLCSICALGRKDLKFGRGYWKNESVWICEVLGIVLCKKDFRIFVWGVLSRPVLLFMISKIIHSWCSWEINLHFHVRFVFILIGSFFSATSAMVYVWFEFISDCK